MTLEERIAEYEAIRRVERLHDEVLDFADRIAATRDVVEALERADEWLTLTWVQLPLTTRRNLQSAYDAAKHHRDAALAKVRGETGTKELLAREWRATGKDER